MNFTIQPSLKETVNSIYPTGTIDSITPVILNRNDLTQTSETLLYYGYFNNPCLIAIDDIKEEDYREITINPGQPALFRYCPPASNFCQFIGFEIRFQTPILQLY